MLGDAISHDRIFQREQLSQSAAEIGKMPIPSLLCFRGHPGMRQEMFEHIHHGFILGTGRYHRLRREEQ